MAEHTSVMGKDKRPPGGTAVLGTLVNGLRVLLTLKDGPRTVQELCHELGLERSAIYRILKTSEMYGFLRRNEDGRSYSLGLILWELATAAVRELDVREVARPYVRNLAEKHGETVHLSIYEAGEVVYIDLEEGSRPIRSYTRLGGRAPAYCVATGKALLAHQSEEQINRISRNLRRFTPATIDTKKRLEAELFEVRESGVAMNLGEWRQDVGGIAAPIYGYDGQAVAAIGMSGPVERIKSNREMLRKSVIEAADQVSAALGRSMTETSEG